MSDDKKDEKKDGSGAKAATKPKAGGGGMMMPMVAVLLTLGVGAGGAYVGVGMLFPAKPAAAGAEGTHGVEAAGHGTEGGKGGHGDNLLHGATEVVLGEIMSNVRGQAGRRYIKLNISMWLEKTVAASLSGGGGGGDHGGGGGGAGESVNRILQSQLEEHLKTYELDEFSDPNINRNLDRGFRQIIEKELHDLYPEIPKETKLVQRIIITGMVVQ